jgi:hypothetical protein
MGLELVQLDEGAGVKQEIDPLARGHLAALALFFQPVLAAAQLGLPREFPHPLGIFFKSHGFNQASRNIWPARQSKQERRGSAEPYQGAEKVAFPPLRRCFACSGSIKAGFFP